MKKIRWGLLLYALILIALLALAGWQLSEFLKMWTYRGNSGYDYGTTGSVQQLDQWRAFCARCGSMLLRENKRDAAVWCMIRHSIMKRFMRLPGFS